MEHLTKTKAVKLRSHLDKYLVADDDRVTVRQSRNAATTRRAIWFVETTSPASVRLRNHATGLYLAASDAAFLLGWTGKRVIQSPEMADGIISLNWEPIRDGFQVKLKTGEGKFLRANGGTPPWRNSVTHDVPVSGATSNWTLWDAEPIDISALAEADGDEFSSISSEVIGSVPESPISSCAWSPALSVKKGKGGMEFFANAKVVRLRSHHGKYLTAEEDQETVSQHRKGSSHNARWTVEFVKDEAAEPSKIRFIRLKSCYGTYLTASTQPFLLGMTGSKVTQVHPPRDGGAARGPRYPDVDWEPVPEPGSAKSGLVKLRSRRQGNFMRANSGPPPWRNSVTHDVPHHRTVSNDWILWHVDILEILPRKDQPEPEYHHHHHHQVLEDQDHDDAGPLTPPPPPPPVIYNSDSFSSSEDSYHYQPTTTTAPAAADDYYYQAGYYPPNTVSKVQEHGGGGGGRQIYYHIADEEGRVDDSGTVGYPMIFNGKSVEDLTRKLQEETSIQSIIVCTRSPLNGKLYPLRLHLPPNNAPIHVVVVDSSSPAASNFEAAGLL